MAFVSSSPALALFSSTAVPVLRFPWYPKVLPALENVPHSSLPLPLTLFAIS